MAGEHVAIILSVGGTILLLVVLLRSLIDETERPVAVWVAARFGPPNFD